MLYKLTVYLVSLTFLTIVFRVFEFEFTWGTAACWVCACVATRLITIKEIKEQLKKEKLISTKEVCEIMDEVLEEIKDG